MSDPSKVSFAGPLAGQRERLTTEFFRLGYAPSMVARHLQLLAHLSRWMADHEVVVERLSWEDIGLFCMEREISCDRRFAPRPVVILMDLLHLGGVPARASGRDVELPPEPEELLACFAGYLRDERSLTGVTVTGYLYQLRLFAQWFIPRFGPDLTVMTIGVIDRFYVERAGIWSMSSARSSTIALRALSRWMFLIGRSTVNLADAIATVKDNSQNDLPKALPATDVAALLSVKMSVRDRAIVLLLTRLGLRASEVSSLTIDDFNWHAGTVLVHGKGNDSQLMPLPIEVGEAIAEYLSGHRRTDSSYRDVFLGTYTPNYPLTRSSVSMVVTYLAKRAGIVGRVGSHRLRHSAATAVLAGGGTLIEAGQLLRHRSAQATMIYARTDHVGLSQLARPWPGPSGQENAHE